MKDKEQQQQQQHLEPIVYESERCIVIIHPPKVTEEEVQRVLAEVARIKATWWRN